MLPQLGNKDGMTIAEDGAVPSTAEKVLTFWFQEVRERAGRRDRRPVELRPAGGNGLTMNNGASLKAPVSGRTQGYAGALDWRVLELHHR